ncbi:MAG: hypothetical protein C3F07_19415 [Anaerolineales bacterium]|nr:MAG: hypothetical protein C3F07_19415 [Anaerolineales bacterium]
MNLHRTKLFLLVFILLLSACAQSAETVPPTAVLPSPTEAIAPTETPTEVPAATDPALFGAIAQSEIQAYSLEPVANAIFTRVMDALAANGDILEYQVTRVTIFPAGDGSLYAEITFNVRTADPSWLADGGTQSADDWIQNKCSRFDFVTTETEFQLKNKRTCN